MGTLRSLAVFVGTGQCNAHCAHCAGIVHRKHAPREDGVVDEELIDKTLRECYHEGARYLSLTSSGEPTLSPLSVTKVLGLVSKCEKEGIKFSNIHVYSNGIRIGEDKSFCDKYLGLWKDYGLETFYVTVHSIDERKNARIYGIESYPPIEQVLSRIHGADLLMRANLVLSKGTLYTFEEFTSTAEHLIKIGVDKIAAWPVRNIDDKLDTELSPPSSELDRMEEWAERNNNPKCHITLLGEKSRVVYETGQKLTLFPDGTLSNSWCS